MNNSRSGNATPVLIESGAGGGKKVPRRAASCRGHLQELATADESVRRAS